ncbi:predicted protein [Postia placenta Mad-698-R]|nr:predicted protein [Postia placenta Mad-698-R]
MPGILASSGTPEAAVVLLSLLTCYLCTRWSHRKYKAYPPGPTPMPFLGNLHQLPVKDQHETFREWAHTYGEVVYAQIFRKPMILLNSLRAVQDLMEKKGAIYSDRAGLTLWEDVYDFKPVTAFMNADEDWREHRKWLQAALETERALTGLHTTLKSSVDKLIIKLLDSPNAFFAHVQRYTSDLTLDLAYGMDELTADEAYSRTAEDAVHAIAHSDSIVASLVDSFPICTYIRHTIGAGLTIFRARSEVYPCMDARGSIQPRCGKGKTRDTSDAGCTVLKTARAKSARYYKHGQIRWHALATISSSNILFDLLLKNITSGVYKPSFASALIEAKSDNGQLLPRVAYNIKGAAATLYVAGAETVGITCMSLRNVDSSDYGAAQSAVVLLTFVLAMTLYPEILQKVQQEIDAVVGIERLPEFRDRKKLRYLECVLLEVYRWGPPTHLGVPHSLTQDDNYKGYFLPKGSTVISNIWAISRDPSIYPDPDAFRPERFEEMDAEKVKASHPKMREYVPVRSICPGRHLAEMSFWLAAATILATLDIHKARDGKNIEPTVSFITGMTRCPQEFVCSIRPRNQTVVELIEQPITVRRNGLVPFKAGGYRRSSVDKLIAGLATSPDSESHQEINRLCSTEDKFTSLAEAAMEAIYSQEASLHLPSTFSLSLDTFQAVFLGLVSNALPPVSDVRPAK